MKNKSSFTPEKIVPIVIILLSLMNISDHIGNILSLSVLLSFIGILGSVLFFLKKPISTKLIYAWLVAQIFVINPFFDLTQGISFQFGFTLGLRSGDVGIKLNVVAIFLLGFVKMFEATNLVGKRITLKKFRDCELADILPAFGIITDRITLEKRKKLAHRNFRQINFL